jgi:hypothetical protein
MEEFIACYMYPLAVSAGFNRVATCMTPVSMLNVLLRNSQPFARMITKMMFSFWRGLNYKQKVLLAAPLRQSAMLALLTCAIEID